MDDVRGDFLRPPHSTTSAAVITNTIECLDPLRAKKTFIRKKMGQTVQFRIINPVSDPLYQRKHTAIYKV